MPDKEQNNIKEEYDEYNSEKLKLELRLKEVELKLVEAYKELKKPKVKFKRIHEDAIIPKYAYDGDSGFDLSSIEDVDIQPLETVLVNTGLSIELPVGTELQIRPRSGLSTKFNNYISNSPGTVDSSYKGIIFIMIRNNTFNKVWKIKKGDRIAQGVVCPVINCEIEEINELLPTTRGADGFGSTGIGEEDNE
uniref:dUTP diphosphatase n=1 Tax=viral metagenome TaxID=1070528 RepID=A0A6M3LJR3_9ZZZZ